MTSSFTFQDAEEYLNSLLVFGIKLGLQNMQVLNTCLNDPASKLQFIHVAGTNGKGSTCAFLATATKAAGLKTGFYSSPFLVSFFERWRINGSPVEEQIYLKAIQKVIAVESEVEKQTSVRPTYFEVLTAVALLIFVEQDCDIVIWETGMGGRLDATNIVDPLLTIITNISEDHGAYLGDTLLEVAGEKAGIIKAGIPLVCGETKPEIKSFFAARAAELQCEAFFIEDDFTISQNEDDSLCFQSDLEQIDYSISLLGEHQRSNSALALKTLQLLQETGMIREIPLHSFNKTAWPGRLQELPNGLIIDGAHNPAAMCELVKYLQKSKPNEKWSIISGMMHDKDISATLRLLAPICEHFYAVPIAIPRAIKTDELSALAKDLLTCETTACNSWQDALELSQVHDNTLIVGSLYLAGEVLGKLAPASALNTDTLES